jgi:hypothetical protein
VGGALLDVGERRLIGDARAVVGDRHLDRRLLHARGQGFRERPGGGPGKHDLVHLHLNQVPSKLGVRRATGEDLLRHRAGRIPGSCAHGVGRPCPLPKREIRGSACIAARSDPATGRHVSRPSGQGSRHAVEGAPPVWRNGPAARGTQEIRLAARAQTFPRGTGGTGATVETVSTQEGPGTRVRACPRRKKTKA